MFDIVEFQKILVIFFTGLFILQPRCHVFIDGYLIVFIVGKYPGEIFCEFRDRNVTISRKQIIGKLILLVLIVRSDEVFILFLTFDLIITFHLFHEILKQKSLL